MRLGIDRETARLALDWCELKWGKSRWADGFPKLRVLKSSARDLTGWYNEDLNLITLNLDLIDSVEELIETIIHEYTHYGQDCRSLYDLLAAEYADRPYEEHPLEKEAYAREREWAPVCKSQLEAMAEGFTGIIFWKSGRIRVKAVK